MIKQALILAASVCGVAIIVASTTGESTPDAPVPEPVETVQKAPVVAPSQTEADDDDYYSDDDDGDSFVFGEPVTYNDDESYAAEPSGNYAATQSTRPSVTRTTPQATQSVPQLGPDERARRSHRLVGKPLT